MIDENGEEIDPDLDPDDPDFVPGGAQTFPFFQNMFGKMNGASEAESAGPGGKKDPAAREKREKRTKTKIFGGILH